MATYRQIQRFINNERSTAEMKVAIVAGYTGYNDYLDNANKQAQGNPSMTIMLQVSGQGSSWVVQANLGDHLFGGTQASLDLPLYKNSYSSSGISDKEAQLVEKEKQFLEARNKISDNPFLDASTVDKRLMRLKNIYETETAPLRSEIATRKADIDTQMGLQTKQFDINNTQTQQAMSQFNTLLSSGALDNASADDIAMITRATGMSSGMVQNAINAQKQSKQKDIQTQTITFDDGTNTGYAIINTQTGEIIKKENVATSKPTKSETTGGGGFTTTQQRNITASARKKKLMLIQITIKPFH